MTDVITTPDAPTSPAFSQAVRAGDTLYVSGTTGIDVVSGDYAGPSIEEQTRQALLNCQTILRAAGADLADAVMVHVLLRHPDDAAGMMATYDEFFPHAKPARCVSQIGVDRPGLLVSIAMTAYVGP